MRYPLPPSEARLAAAVLLCMGLLAGGCSPLVPLTTPLPVDHTSSSATRDEVAVARSGLPFSTVRGQEPEEWSDRPPLPQLLSLEPPAASPEPLPRTPRLRLFRIQPGFISEPVDLDQQDDSSTDPSGAVLPPTPDTGPDWLQIWIGNDRPGLDLRQRGDPGGIGFYRVNTQVQLVGTETTSLALGFQAVTPAGVQFGGLSNGPTVVSPAISVFQQLSDDGTALQGFVGKNMPLLDGSGPWYLQRRVRAGVALQRPFDPSGTVLPNVYWSVSALTQYQALHDATRPSALTQVIPGLHWKLGDNVWLSSGLAVPTHPSHSDPGKWQLNCSVRY